MIQGVCAAALAGATFNKVSPPAQEWAVPAGRFGASIPLVTDLPLSGPEERQERSIMLKDPLRTKLCDILGIEFPIVPEVVSIAEGTLAAFEELTGEFS